MSKRKQDVGVVRNTTRALLGQGLGMGWGDEATTLAPNVFLNLAVDGLTFLAMHTPAEPCATPLLQHPAALTRWRSLASGGAAWTRHSLRAKRLLRRGTAWPPL